MNWKNWPYWVKGVIIAEIFFILFLILVLLIPNNNKFPSVIHPAQLLPLSPGIAINLAIFPECFTVARTIFRPEYCDPSNVFLAYFIPAFIFYFIIGALIGLIYGKIKNRKKV